MCKWRSVKSRFVSVFLAGFAAGGGCFATGYYGPSEYFPTSEQSLDATPEFYWALEVNRIAQAFRPTEAFELNAVKQEGSSDEKPAVDPRAKATADADLSDFAAARKEGRIKPGDPEKASQQHNEGRDLIASTDEKQTGAMPAEFASEFADYHRGAFAYRRGKAHWDEARKAWEDLLKRPAAERHYRTVWAAFQLGKVAMKSGDYAAAATWFQKVRALAKDGFADSLGMAADSYGWEGRCEWKLGNPEKAAPLFLTQLALGDQSAVISLKALIPDRLPIEGMLNYGAEAEEMQNWNEAQKASAQKKTDEALLAAAKDPLLRRLVTVHILATESGRSWVYEGGAQASKRCAHWLAAIKEAKLGKVKDAEYLGWCAYAGANYQEAAQWLALAQPVSPAACWLRAKLLRRDGKLDAAAKSMEQAWRAINDLTVYVGAKDGGPDREVLLESEMGYDGGLSFSECATGDFGLLRLARGEFVEAFDTLYKGGLWTDAAFLAERVLTTDELKAYVDALPAASAEASDDPRDKAVALRWLLGRRLVREDRYDEAARYIKPPYDKLLAKYVQAAKDGADEKLGKQERARAYFTAAWMARYDGMELMGTEVAPDGFVSEGSFPSAEIAKQRQSGKYSTAAPGEEAPPKAASKPMLLKPTQEELKRLAKNRPAPDVRFHYRIIAGALAAKAARLLDDNTDELADVLNTAGNWVKDGDGKLGDRYCQMLEARCPKTDIGKAVGKKHWFVDLVGPWSEEQKESRDALHKALGLEGQR